MDPSIHETQRKIQKLSKKELLKLRKEKLKMNKQQKRKEGKKGGSHTGRTERQGGGSDHKHSLHYQTGHGLAGHLCADATLVVLVLRILATFDMRGMQLLPFVHDVVAAYLDDSNPAIRKQAVHTCTSVMVHYTATSKSPSRGPTSKLRCKVLDRVLTIAVADHEPSIRAAAITSLRKEFDSDLAQAEMLRSLFIALNDEVFEIREKTISVIGR